MATTLLGPVTWSMERDDDGHRTYRITHAVAAAVTDGPAAVLLTSGLPQPGDAWTFGGADADAYCTFETSIKPHPGHDEGDKTHKWYVTSTFTTKHKDLCPDETIGDPLLVPPKISITSVPRKEEGQYDRNGDKITNSSHEALRGPQNEWDVSSLKIRVTQNVAPSGKQTIAEHIDKVNSDTMWDYPARTVKLSEASLERHIYGPDCTVYWTRTLGFDIDMRTHDRDIADEGTKVLLGDWVGTSYVLRRIGRIAKPDQLVAGEEGTGTLADGAYTYAVTAVDSLDNETDPATDSITLNTGGAGSVHLSWTAAEDAYFYRIYRNLGGSWVKIDEVTMNEVTYTDDGSASTTSQDPPTTNQTGRDPDPDDPKDFHRFADRDGNVCRVMLNGAGLPAGARVGTGTTDEGVIHVERYEGADLITLFGLPADLESS